MIRQCYSSHKVNTNTINIAISGNVYCVADLSSPRSAAVLSSCVATSRLTSDGTIRAAEGHARDMTEIRTGRGTGDGLIWRCLTHKACKHGIRERSFFEKSRLELKVLAMLLYLWSLEVSIVVATTLSSVSERHVIQWFQTSAMLAAVI